MYGSKISMIRLARGYTQDYMAKKLGIAQNVYSKIEKNEKSTIDETMLEKIALLLGVSTEDIKSPTPIVMSFLNREFDRAEVTQNNYSSERVIEELNKQIKHKDDLIYKLLGIIEKSGS